MRHSDRSKSFGICFALHSDMDTIFFFFLNAGQYFGPVFCKVPTLHFDKDAANPTPRG